MSLKKCSLTTNYNIPNHPLPGIKGFHFASLFQRHVKKRCKGKTNKKQNREFYIVKGQTNKKQNRQFYIVKFWFFFTII